MFEVTFSLLAETSGVDRRSFLCVQPFSVSGVTGNLSIVSAGVGVQAFCDSANAHMVCHLVSGPPGTAASRTFDQDCHAVLDVFFDLDYTALAPTGSWLLNQRQRGGLYASQISSPKSGFTLLDRLVFSRGNNWSQLSVERFSPAISVRNSLYVIFHVISYQGTFQQCFGALTARITRS